MATERITDLLAGEVADDDWVMVDGTTAETRKIPAGRGGGAALLDARGLPITAAGDPVGLRPWQAYPQIRDGRVVGGYAPPGITKLPSSNRTKLYHYGHQGYTVDADGYRYVIDSNHIYKLSPANDSVVADADPSSGPSCSHMGDGQAYRGYLWVVCENWNNHVYSDPHILQVSLSDLSLVHDYPLQQANNTSGLAWSGMLVYVASYEGQPPYVYRFFGGNLHQLGRLDIDYVPLNANGIAIWGTRLALWTTRLNLYIYDLLDPMTARLRHVVRDNSNGGGQGEGIHWGEPGTITVHMDAGNSEAYIEELDVGGLSVDYQHIGTTDPKRGIYLPPPAPIGQLYMRVNMASNAYNNTLFDTPTHQDRGEAWVYTDGNLAVRFGETYDKVVTTGGPLKAGQDADVRIRWYTDHNGDVHFELIVNGQSYGAETNRFNYWQGLALGGIHVNNTDGSYELKRLALYADYDVDHSQEVFG